MKIGKHNYQKDSKNPEVEHGNQEEEKYPKTTHEQGELENNFEEGELDEPFASLIQ